MVHFVLILFKHPILSKQSGGFWKSHVVNDHTNASLDVHLRPYLIRTLTLPGINETRPAVVPIQKRYSILRDVRQGRHQRRHRFPNDCQERARPGNGGLGDRLPQHYAQPRAQPSTKSKRLFMLIDSSAEDFFFPSHNHFWSLRTANISPRLLWKQNKAAWNKGSSFVSLFRWSRSQMNYVEEWNDARQTWRRRRCKPIFNIKCYLTLVLVYL